MVLTQQIHKKPSIDRTLTLYLPQRIFIDSITRVEHIDGVVVLEGSPKDGVEILAQLVLTYRYGREEDEVMGLSFSKEIVISSFKLSPSSSGERHPLTTFQEMLLSKLGKNAVPFLLQFPLHSPSSITLQQGPKDRGKACGIEWEVKVFSHSDQVIAKSVIRMVIRKHQQFIVNRCDSQEPTTVSHSKEFPFSKGKLHLQVSLDKKIYYHGEAIKVDVKVVNNSTKQVKKIKISAVQICNVSLGAKGCLKNVVSFVETQEGFPIQATETYEKQFCIRPSLTTNKHLRGLAIDFIGGHGNGVLAPSTDHQDEPRMFPLGMTISYIIRVKLWTKPLGGELAKEFPYQLLHSPPTSDPPQLVIPAFSQSSFNSSKKESEDAPETARRKSLKGLFNIK